MIWEYMEKGMASAAWAVGFIVVAGLFAGVLYLFCLLMKLAFSEDEESDTDAGDTKDVAEGPGAGGNAAPVGRHLYRRAGDDD